MTTPASEFEALQAEERANMMQTFKRVPLELVRGDNALDPPAALEAAKTESR